LSLTIELKRQAPLLERERLTWLVLHKTLYHLYQELVMVTLLIIVSPTQELDEFEVGIGTVTDAATRYSYQETQ
jgi:hypothetical protein